MLAHLGNSCSGHHCMESARIQSYSGPLFSRISLHLDWIRRDTYLSVFSPNVGKCGKNADLNNSEYGRFLGSALISKYFWLYETGLNGYFLCKILDLETSFKTVLFLEGRIMA